MNPALVLLLALTAAVGATSCGSCAVWGCRPQAQITADVPVEWERLRAANITVCRNGTCENKSLALIAEPPSESNGGRFLLGGGPGDVPRMDLFVFRSGATLSIRVTWTFAQARPGDRYRLDITDAAGSILSVSDLAISYGSQPVVSQDCKEHPCPFFVSDHRGAGPDAGADR
ncbi:MAG TPA: hypothetical protein VN914_10140 [Polyangia bacterium]|nr:hypothetical protein [Polyangia bacterium]